MGDSRLMINGKNKRSKLSWNRWWDAEPSENERGRGRLNWLHIKQNELCVKNVRPPKLIANAINSMVEHWLLQLCRL